ncbi:DDE family transposase [Herbihabitans rhizosphaerae]|uniref:DDE family transposase n=1 Tax=Herbihabitans rhizosphaerae TaxID=1872711 RepID=A0A4Q7KKM7_9PSEU|nr:IS1380 family transposase [Herbihabitans rhizosphaerae]RZS37035.1 DDE family transposase [Herbihabitans rhizosphaerae]
MAVVRAQPGVFGAVASDPTVSRLIDRLAEESGEGSLAAIRAARADARARVWQMAGVPRQAGLVVLDLDATLVIAHSDKEWAAKTWKKTFGFHPLLGYVDHVDGGTGEPVASLLRKGNAGSNTTTDHLTVLDQALAQLPEDATETDVEGRRAVLVHTDAAGATHGFTKRIAELGMQFSVGAYLHQFDITTVLARSRLLPREAWTPTYDTDRCERDGAWVAEATGLVDLTAWPPGTRLILRKERPHPGAQLRFTDTNGLRVTGLLTNTAGGQHADLELRHRRHARVEDRIRAAKDTGLRNLPFHDATQNTLWLEICALAQDLVAWTQRLALTGWAAVAEPNGSVYGFRRGRPTGPHRTPPTTQDPHHLALGRHPDHRTPTPHASQHNLNPPPRPQQAAPGAPAQPAKRAHRHAQPPNTSHKDQHPANQDHPTKITKDRG